MLKASCLALALLAAAAPSFAHDTDPLKCRMCTQWNQPQQPFKVYGNTWYVGTIELSAILVTSPGGHILLDAALPQSAPLIARNIEALGFRLQDVKLIVNSHAHFDHAGGIAAMQRMTGARVAASPSAAQALRDGHIGKDDPQYEPGFGVAQVAAVTHVHDGQTLKVGPLRLVAHFTPGHTPGGITWSWKSCEGERCLDVVYADSLNAMSNDGFYFSGGAGTPDITQSFKDAIDKVAQLPCDITLSVHPGFTDIMEKHARQSASNNPFIAKGECKTYALDASKRLTQRLAREQVEKSSSKP